MADSTKRWAILTRGLAILTALTLGVMAMTPSFSAFKPTKKKVKKIATKQATAVLQQRIGDFGNPIFIEETELNRFFVEMGAGQSDVTLFTVGPFTMLGSCEDQGGGNIDVTAYLTTTAPGSAMSSEYAPGSYVFGPGSSPDWQRVTSSGPNTETTDPGIGQASAPGGTTFDAAVNVVAELGGQDCTFFGYVIPTNA